MTATRPNKKTTLKPVKGTDPQTIAIEGVFNYLFDLILRKNYDYGSNVFSPPVLNPTSTAESAILTRLSDKFARLQNILRRDSMVADETLEDTIADIAGYCILFLSNRRLNQSESEATK
ncbi:MAG: DUF1599 domain-containing protein [Thermoguttaceae bacterium]|nr:DUF1599 domain-containing protein [Thermoguttaceae bacterium]